MWKILSCSILTLIAASTYAAEPAPAQYASDQVVVKITESAWAQWSEDPAEFMRQYGLIAMRPVIRSRPNRFSRFGLHRVSLAMTQPGADIRELVTMLQADAAVEYAEPNSYVYPGAAQAIPDDTHFQNEQWNLNNTGQTLGTPDADIDAAEAWTVATGRPEIMIAVLDTGIRGNHPELRDRVARGGYSFPEDTHLPKDDHHHGTQVSGIIGGRVNNRFVIAGINGWSPILPVQVLSDAGPGTSADIADGIVFAVDNGAAVLNMSIVSKTPNLLIIDSVAYAEAAGVTQIGCNGNDGTTQLNYPASYSEVISAGQTDHNDQRGALANVTNTLDVVAPGVMAPTTRWGDNLDEVVLVNGWSFAAPHVSAVSGVLLALDPTLTPTQVRNVLQSTAIDMIGDPTEDLPGRDDYYGWGRINMDAAVRSLGLMSTSSIHVADITFERVDAGRLGVFVVVLDDLTGAEDGVLVEGILTLPDTSTTPLSATSGSNGVAVLSYEPGGTLPTGTFTFTLDTLDKSGSVHDAAADRKTQVSHDPDLDGVHVNAIDLSDDFNRLTIDIQVFDNDDRHEGSVLVEGALTPPTGPTETLSATTGWSAAGVARILHSPATLDAGTYTFEVTSLTKSGFVHEIGRDVESMDNHAVEAAGGDSDLDSITNDMDNCRNVANASQADTDGDGIGDACDTCPEQFDPAQIDTDSDGTGDRCECAPYDSSSTRLGDAWAVHFDANKTTLRWNGVSGADSYDISRGLIGSLDGTDYGDCLVEDHAETSFDDGSSPPPGEGYFYLVRADDVVCAPGSWGMDSNETERINGNVSACVP